MGFLDSLLGLNAGDPTIKAAKKNRQVLSDLERTGFGYINSGEQKSAGALNKAIAGYNPYTAAGADAVGMYSNALGLNGADGSAAATEAFQTGPGYQFAMDQGTQAALRGASAAGMLNSGNTLTALTQYGQGLANQEYGSWLDRLSGLTDTGLSATNGQANAYGGLASLYQGTTDDRLSLASGVAQGRMGLNNQMAQGQTANNSALSGLFGNLVSGGAKIISGGLF
ncbi:hypothetical protein QTA58_00220 [Neorhizobium sp. CSC1952]|uniref:hypothetical protein n=1 Tax=Neorhizobium sp. CSC1952 TaxID=2978974 RepID=UPI0025A57FB7|nr:hypothetical protein [Rhizobium sp. CSC1952]WJR67234.1 hypothetical protein QTA58_00220 [Rhizobium sp. CSC1952]